MQQLMYQIAALLNQKPKETKINGMCLNTIYLSDQWVLDSGATDHMTENKNLLHNFVSSNTIQYVIVANGDKMKILGFGSIKIFSKIYHKFY
jgi:CRISPR/Cas system CMR-associated protein Cmr3 (group 5 of RAMP superfamily)